jgi:hypothetical protein
MQLGSCSYDRSYVATVLYLTLSQDTVMILRTLKSTFARCDPFFSELAARKYLDMSNGVADIHRFHTLERSGHDIVDTVHRHGSLDDGIVMKQCSNTYPRPMPDGKCRSHISYLGFHITSLPLPLPPSSSSPVRCLHDLTVSYHLLPACLPACLPANRLIRRVINMVLVFEHFDLFIIIHFLSLKQQKYTYEWTPLPIFVGIYTYVNTLRSDIF